MTFEEALVKSVEISNAAYAEVLLKDYNNECIHNFSERFEKKIRKLYYRANHPLVYRVLRSVASVVLATLVATGTLLAVNTEARAAFIGWVKEFYETLFVYRFVDSKIEADNATIERYCLTWLPDGCSELMATDDGSTFSVVYLDQQGRYLKFHYTGNVDETVWYIDVSKTTREESVVDGYKADLFIANDAESASAIMWTDADDRAYCISGYLSLEELLKIAESVAYVKIENIQN